MGSSFLWQIGFFCQQLHHYFGSTNSTIWVIRKSIHFPPVRKNVFHLLKEEHEKNLCEKSWIFINLLYITIMIRNCTKVDTYAYLLLDLFFWSLLEHLRKSLYCLYQTFFTTKFFSWKNSCTKPKIAAFFWHEHICRYYHTRTTIYYNNL